MPDADIFLPAVYDDPISVCYATPSWGKKPKTKFQYNVQLRKLHDPTLPQYVIEQRKKYAKRDNEWPVYMCMKWWEL